MWDKKYRDTFTVIAWGAGSILYQSTTQNLKNLSTHVLNSNAAKGINEQKVCVFMQAPWIHQPLNKKGILPLQADLQRIAAIQNANDILHEAATEYNTNLLPMFSFYVISVLIKAAMLLLHILTRVVWVCRNKNIFIQVNMLQLHIFAMLM